MSDHDERTRLISQEASRVTERFMSTIDRNITASGLEAPTFPSRDSVVEKIADWVQTAIEAEVNEEHDENRTLENSLKDVDVRAKRIGISQSGEVLVWNAKVDGDGWSTVTKAALIEMPQAYVGVTFLD
ncbi:hypothetical protein L202_05671 [Cryptococcus amylolentus CBS 6039]|uniref:Uncharacterized protein n=1 Tax=Cryptococcus amylolentus CBS 6039 TaxID=1295533 RepID=A0A1E3HNW7_9TREE|nr:hypothetical protein L202_05671 [Cryptococcus amylolentus CBS 6039]ODN77141.1 hypothetical protein L202_05671 [Cryptococcus amylolentus CBS 6039]